MNYWFSEGMGYAENLLPAAMARLGHEVHLVTSDAQVYYHTPMYARTYEPFLGPPIVPCGVKQVGGVTVHRLPRRSVGWFHGVRGLVEALRALRPDVVQGFEASDLMAVEAALARRRAGYRLFVESHVHRSIFSTTGRRRIASELAWRAYAWTLGRRVSAASERCYAISKDSAEIAHAYFGIAPEKIALCSLGVDTEAYRPATTPDALRAREERRRALGFGPAEVVCVYTGRFSRDKNPLLLADAVAALQGRGRPFRGLFVGDGEQADALRARAGCVVHAFVPSRELPPLYQAADVGVWPKQESTSQLDAAACGLPIVIGDRAEVRDRVEGNGAVYAEDRVDDLARVLETLIDPEVRRRLGAAGAEKMQARYSWDFIARERARDYLRALGQVEHGQS